MRRVLVTGGSGGLGGAIAAALGRDGFDVTVAFRSNETAAEKVAAAIVDAGGRARFTPVRLPEIAIPPGMFFLTTRRGHPHR